MIYKFTNTKGLDNYGLIIEQLEIGANVLMDSFQPTDKSSLPVRYQYITMQDSRYVIRNGTRGVLPISAKGIKWNDSRLGRLQVRIASQGWQCAGVEAFVDEFADLMDSQLLHWLRVDRDGAPRPQEKMLTKEKTK